MNDFEERVTQVLRECYMGEMPEDPWVIILRFKMAALMREVYDEGKKAAR